MHPRPSPRGPAFVSVFCARPVLGSARARALSARARPTRTAAGRAPVVALLPLEAVAANPAALETVAGAFRTLHMPDWLVERGHPAMMAVMVLFMGVPGALQGWRGRLNPDRKEGVNQKKQHELIMIAFLLLAVLGGLGGTLSVAIQGDDVWQSSHAKTAAIVLLLLSVNATLAYSGFTLGNDGKPQSRLKARTFHAFFGAATMAFFAVHAYLGFAMLLE